MKYHNDKNNEPNHFYLWFFKIILSFFAISSTLCTLKIEQRHSNNFLTLSVKYSHRTSNKKNKMVEVGAITFSSMRCAKSTYTN